MTIPASRRQRAKRGEKTAKTGDAADTLSDHLIGEGLEKPEIAGICRFLLPSVCRPVFDGVL